ncbi:hypothetical protein ACCO45_012411 [Purpureocillium lilacinum]|uniref:Uncharacterized protein n=1 Tax=Purpureocillium lilacinum TaxID=33203 RepID=A0ACC4D8N6_PURLI
MAVSIRLRHIAGQVDVENCVGLLGGEALHLDCVRYIRQTAPAVEVNLSDVSTPRWTLKTVGSDVPDEMANESASTFGPFGPACVVGGLTPTCVDSYTETSMRWRTQRIRGQNMARMMRTIRVIITANGPATSHRARAPSTLLPSTLHKFPWSAECSQGNELAC